MRLNNSTNNGIKVLAFGVAYTPRTVVLSGIAWIWDGIGRRSAGQTSNLSGKPTNLESFQWSLPSQHHYT